MTRGDAINGFGARDRAADASRMLAAHWHSAATLNYMRMQGHIWGRCREIEIGGGGESRDGVGYERREDSNRYIFTSHECLLLPMEAALTDAETRFNNVALFLACAV
jgi:3-deoxy-D-arabino-heptulosonate 7-phosphate (DAHP) synthase class II